MNGWKEAAQKENNRAVQHQQSVIIKAKRKKCCVNELIRHALGLTAAIETNLDELNDGKPRPYLYRVVLILS